VTVQASERTFTRNSQASVQDGGSCRHLCGSLPLCFAGQSVAVRPTLREASNCEVSCTKVKQVAKCHQEIRHQLGLEGKWRHQREIAPGSVKILNDSSDSIESILNVLNYSHAAVDASL
jgi:hypothetical protein